MCEDEVAESAIERVQDPLHVPPLKEGTKLVADEEEGNKNEMLQYTV